MADVENPQEWDDEQYDDWTDEQFDEYFGSPDDPDEGTPVVYEGAIVDVPEIPGDEDSGGFESGTA